MGRSFPTCTMRTMAAISKSERYARTELDVARVVAILVDQAERGVARVLIGIPEHRVIERVDGLDPHLQVDAAGQAKRLVEAEVEQVEVRGPHARQRGGEVTDVVCELDAAVGASRAARNVKTRGIPRRAVETGLAAAGTRSADVRAKVARVATRVVVDVAVPGQRESGLPLVGGADGPAAEDRVGEGVPVAAPFLPVAPRQIHRGAEGGAIRAVVGRDAALQLIVRRIEEVQAI